MKKRLFSRLMAMLMTLALLSTTGFAAVFTQDSIDKNGNLKLTENNDYNYHLESNVDLEQTVKIGSGVDAIIDLNGWTLRHTGETGSVIAVTDGGKLTLEDSSGKNEDGEYVSAGEGKVTGGKGTWVSVGWTSGDDGGGIYVAGTGSEFTMRGGNISGNEAYQGGGIAAIGDVSLNIEGGNITKNFSTDSGGGVYTYEAANNAPNVVMTGGTVSNNAAAQGGGIEIGKGTFTMNGGSISKNTAKRGGGILGNVNSTVTINDGEISENEGKEGAGVSSASCTVNFNGGAIWGNKGIGIFTNYGGKAYLNGGLLCGNSEGAAIGSDSSYGGEISIPNNSTTEIHNDHGVVVDPAAAPTCTADGHTAGKHCADCGMVLVEQEVIRATGHTSGTPVRENEVAAQPGFTGSYDEVVYCTVCGDEISRTTVTIPALPMPIDFGDGTGGDTGTTIDDEATPLAGIVTEAQLLDELYKHEGSPAVELVEKYASHEYAPAISWALANAIVVDDENFDPDELLTVALLREVLVNFVEYKGIDFTVVVDGADDELVLDLSERLTVFFAQLEK